MGRQFLGLPARRSRACARQRLVERGGDRRCGRAASAEGLRSADAAGQAKLPASSPGCPGRAGRRSCRSERHVRNSSDENAPAAIIFTSGTEGRAKAVVLSHRSLIAVQQMLLHVTRRLPFTPSADYGEVTLHTGPLFHIGRDRRAHSGRPARQYAAFPDRPFDPGEAIELIARSHHPLERRAHHGDPAD